jgi:hypothetical protein
MSRNRLPIRLTRIASITLTFFCCAGCVAVPVHTATKTVSVSGATGKKLELDFIKIGSTSREEVLQKLGWVDTGVKNDRLFVGRWADSSWGVVWAAGGGYSGAAGWNRSWTMHTLVLEFNEQGVTEKMSFVSDEELASALDERLSKGPAGLLDLATPITLSVEYLRSGNHVPGKLILSHDDLRFLQESGVGSNVAYDFKTPPVNLSHLTTGSRGAAHSSHPQNLTATIHFKQKTSVGSKFTVQIDVPSTVVLLLYIREAQSGFPASKVSEARQLNLFHPDNR